MVSGFEEAMRPVYDKLQNDSEFVNKLVKMFTIEVSKGNEKFNRKSFYFFKALFRNFGSSKIINNVYNHLNNLINDRDTATHECSHKLASELLAGLIRGSKYWPFDQLTQMWTQLKPLLDSIFDNISPVSVNLWLKSFDKSFSDQDPRRMTFYINYFSDLMKRIFMKHETSDTLQSSSSSIQQSSCLTIISTFAQFEWRAEEFWCNNKDIFISNLSHPYKEVREKNAICLVNYSLIDTDYSIYKKLKSKKEEEEEEEEEEMIISTSDINDSFQNLNKLVCYFEERLSKCNELSSQDIDESTATIIDYNSPQHLDSINFLHSLFTWFSYYYLRALQPANTVVLRLIPRVTSILIFLFYKQRIKPFFD
jgi:hypothetical protein